MKTLGLSPAASALLFATLLASAVAQESNRVIDLQPGIAVGRTLWQGERQIYQLVIESGRYVRLRVDPGTIDVIVALRDSSGKTVTELDTGLEAGRPRYFIAIAEDAGIYRLEVKRSDDRTKGGTYSIVLEALRLATDSDRMRVAAERELAEGYELHGGVVQKRRLAVDKYKSALEKFQTLGEETRVARTLLVLGDVSDFLGDSKAARGYFDQLMAGIATVDPLEQVQALNRIGNFYSTRLFEHQKALDFLEQASATAEGARHPGGQAAALNNMADIYGRLGDIRKALAYEEKAMPLYHEFGDRKEEATGLNGLGYYYAAVGEYEKALNQYRKSLELRKLANDERGEARTLNNIGMLYDGIGEYPRALDYYQRAMEKRIKAGNQREVATTRINMAVVRERMGESSKALDGYEQALKVFHETGDREREASAVNNIGGIYLNGASPDYPRAIAQFRQAITLWQSVRNRGGEAISTFNLGKAFARIDEIDQAIRTCNGALEMARSSNSLNLQPAVLLQLAQLSKKRGDMPGARAQIDEALRIVEDLRSRIAGPTERASWLALVHSLYEFEVDLLMNLGETSSALEWAERARARSLLDTLSAAGLDIREGVDDALLKRERSLHQQVEALSASQRKLLTGPHSPKQETAGAEALERALGDYREAVTAIRVSNPSYAALAQAEPLEVQRIQREVLDADTALLEYVLGEERSFLWVVTQQHMASFELARRSEVERLVRQFQEQLGARNRQVAGETGEQRRRRVSQAELDAPKTAEALSRILIWPAAAELTRKRLAIVVGDALQYVPFAALPGPGRPDSQPLAVDHEIVMLPSASTLSLLRRQFADRKRGPKLLAVLADPVFDPEDVRISGNDEGHSSLAARGDEEPGLEAWKRAARVADVSTAGVWLPRLRASRQEARAIVSLAPPRARLLALDFHASRATAMSRELADYRIVHFATHGFLDGQHPDLSGLVLSLVDKSGKPADGFLRLHDISALKLPADLVVLSACQTALGRETRGEGLSSMARAFMHAGAARVVASLWKVDDSATAELMKRFYEGMLGPRKLSAAGALREAQVGLRSQTPWRSPYYWAGFVLQGDWK